MRSEVKTDSAIPVERRKADLSTALTSAKATVGKPAFA